MKNVSSLFFYSELIKIKKKKHQPLITKFLLRAKHMQ